MKFVFFFSRELAQLQGKVPGHDPTANIGGVKATMGKYSGGPLLGMVKIQVRVD